MAAAEDSVRESWLAPVEIFGTQSEIIEYPSEPQRISSKKLETLQATDIARALKQVSGTYVREEDGQGLRPNIGLRGTNPDRSKKVSLLQDGILIGPAPYSAPAAYYTPSLVLTDSLEVFRGFSALPYGPNSVGGAVNYLTQPLIDKKGAQVKATAGSFGAKLFKASVTQKFDQHHLLLQAARVETNGFKKIDRGGDTGYEQNYLFLKWGYFLPHPKDLTHEIRLHLAYEDENSHETYLGLSESDFKDSFKRRYNASQLDLMKWNHQTFQIHHQYQLSSTSSLQSAIYHHTFSRTWYRLDRFNDNSVNLRSILNDPTSFSNYYDILKGTQDSTILGANGELVMASNDRTYFSQGLQTQWSSVLSHGKVNHEIEASLRLHADEIKRDHAADRFEMLSQQMVRSSAPRTIEDLNEEKATAWTAVMLDHIRFDDWTLTPAFRYENVQFRFKDELAQTKNSRDDDIFIPGISLMKKLNPESSLRASVNAAATLAGLSSLGDERREEATLYEVEWNHVNSSAQVEGQATFFLNDYRNLTGTCSASSGCSNALLDTQFNGGKAQIYGTELKAGKNFQVRKFDIPITWNLTYLNSSFESEFDSTSPEWGIGLVKKGDPLPYVPKVLSSVSVGLRSGQLYQELAFFYQSSVYDQTVELNRKKIDAYGIVDWSAQYSYSQNGQILAKIDNLLAREYVVAARPFGYRPGKPQSFQIGFQQRF